jgi:hypothetical protein
MTDLATGFVRKIQHKMDRSPEVLPADIDLLDIATERFAYICWVFQHLHRNSKFASMTRCEEFLNSLMS